MFNLSAAIAYHARRAPDRAAIVYRDETRRERRIRRS